MPTEEIMKNARDGIALIGEVIKAAGDNPQVREAGLELGKTALTVTKTINNVFLPLAALNFAFDKARKYFSEQFKDDMAQKAATIPAEEIIEPKASIAGPAIQGLAFCHEERDLKEMYLNLLASAMDGRVSEMAHPAFVEIIKQLNSKEALLLKYILDADNGIPIVEVRVKSSNGITYNILYRHLIDLRHAETSQAEENESTPAMVDNWIRLGLISVDYQMFMSDEVYSWVENRPEFSRYREQETNGNIVYFQKGVMIRTAWGRQFAKVVGLT